MKFCRPSVHLTKKAVLLSDRPSSNDCPVLCKWFWLAIFGVASDSAYKPLPPSVLLQAFFLLAASTFRYDL